MRIPLVASRQTATKCTMMFRCTSEVTRLRWIFPRVRRYAYGPNPLVDSGVSPPHSCPSAPSSSCEICWRRYGVSTPEKFSGGSPRAGTPVAVMRPKGPHLIEAHDFNLAPALRGFGDEWFRRRAFRYAGWSARRFDEAGDVAFEDEMQARP